MNFEEVNLIIEGVSKSQKEAGQRAMAVQAYQLKNQLISWFNDRWSAKNAHNAGLTLDKKKIEKERLDRILKRIEEFQEGKTPYDTKDTADFRRKLEHTMGAPVQWRTALSNDGYIKGSVNKIEPVSEREKQLFKTNPESFLLLNVNSIDTVSNKFNILHEHKHLLDALKEIITTGTFDIKGTFQEICKGHLAEVQKDEGQANAYALDNIYRKDRLKYLASTPEGRIITKTKRKEKAPSRLGLNIYKDIYAQGTVKNSKTLETSKKNVIPAITHILHKRIKAALGSKCGQELLKEYNISDVQKLYNFLCNIKVEIDPKIEKSKSASDIDFKKGKFYVGDFYLDRFFWYENKPEATIRNNQDNLSICRSTRDAIIYYKFGRK